MRPLGLLALALVLALAGTAASLHGGATRPTPPGARPPGQFPAPRPRTHAVVWAVGDAADGGTTARALAARLRRTRLDLLLYLGDVYAEGTAREYARNYHPVFGRFRTRTAPTPGNHEWPRRAEGYEPYWRRVTGRRPPAHYALRVAGWQILSLNSQEPLGPRSPQGRWLRRSVAAGGTCRLAFWHRPRWSAGAHGDQGDVAPLWDALAGRARIVLNGHDHNLQRFRPIDGMTEFVSGAGGTSLYELDESDPRVAFADDDTHGALRLELTPGRARYAFLALGGRVLDSGTIACRPRIRPD